MIYKSFHKNASFLLLVPFLRNHGTTSEPAVTLAHTGIARIWFHVPLIPVLSCICVCPHFLYIYLIIVQSFQFLRNLGTNHIIFTSNPCGSSCLLGSVLVPFGSVCSVNIICTRTLIPICH